MHRPDIKARLLMAGHNQSTVAEAAKATQSAVSRVISGELVSPRIAAAIAAAIGSTPSALWPRLYATTTRRTRRAA